MTAETANNALEIGAVQDDGTVFAGVVKGEKLYAAPQDIKRPDGDMLAVTFNEAARYAEKLNSENYLGHNDWRVPNRRELKALYKSKEKGALKDTFNKSRYWSSTSIFNGKCAYMKDFYNGASFHFLDPGMPCSVRLVR